MPGHIKLGAPGALRDYMIANLDLYVKSPANQFAAKLATGGGNYNDLQNWSYWVMDDWRAGVGRKDTEGGGFLYAEAETRYPNQIRPARSLRLRVTNNNYEAYDPNISMPLLGTVDVGSSHTYKRLAYKWTGTTAAAVFVRLLIKNDSTATTATVAIYSNSLGLPSASIGSATITLTQEKGWGVYIAQIAANTLTGVDYHVVVYPSSGTLTMPYRGSNSTASYYNGSSWTAIAPVMMHAPIFLDTASPDSVSHVITFGSGVYASIADSFRKHYLASGLAWSTLRSVATDITDLLVWGDKLYIGIGDSTNFQYMSTGESFTVASVPARLFASWNGYLWRAVENDVFYSSDGSTWTGPIEVGPDGFAVRGMAGLGDYMYVSTDEGLYYIGYGDFVFGVTQWGYRSVTNGVGMTNYQGALYIPLGHDLFRFDGNAMMPIGVNLGEGLPADRSGNVAFLAKQNNWLYMGINPTDSLEGRSTIWVYDGQAWSFVASFPAEVQVTAATVNLATIYIGTNIQTLFVMDGMADASQAPDDSTYYGCYGWVETDWFFGGLKEVQKDFESVYVTGDFIDSSKYVEVYWQDDDSTDWELLGTVTADRQELRWDDYTTRPNTRQLKLGLALYSKGSQVYDIPVVRAVRVKYHPMVSDWFRWSFPILVSDNQQMLGGSINSYTAEEMEQHLDSMITRVPPLIFQDLRGTQYEVKVTGCQIQALDYEYIGGEPKLFSIYNMAIEQIRNGEYEA